MFQLLKLGHKNAWNLGEIPGIRSRRRYKRLSRSAKVDGGTVLVFQPLSGKVMWERMVDVLWVVCGGKNQDG